MEEVLQNRCSSFFAKNMCIGDSLCKQCRRKVYRLEKNRCGSCIIVRLFAVSAFLICYYVKSPIYWTVHVDSVRMPLKNPFTSTNIILPVIFVVKIKATCIFITKCQSVCVVSHIYHVQACSYSNVF